MTSNPANNSDPDGAIRAVPQIGGDEAWRLDLSDASTFFEVESLAGEWWGRLTVKETTSRWERLADYKLP